MVTMGAALLWYFVGNVVEVNRKEILAGEPVTLTIPETTPKLQRKLRTHIALSRVGLFLTVVGGALQVASNYMSE